MRGRRVQFSDGLPMELLMLGPAATPRARLLAALALALGYFGLSRVGLLLIDGEALVGVLWPASGLALAVFAMTGRSRWPELWAAVFAGNLAAQLVERPSTAALGLAAVNATEPVLAAYVWQRVTGPEGPGIFTVRGVCGLAAAATAANAVTALGGALTVHLALGAPLLTAWGTWIVGDGLGMLVVAPLVLAFAVRQERPAARRAPALALPALVAGVTAVVFAQPYAGSSAFVQYPFALIPALTAVAVWGRLRVVTSSVLLCSVISAVATLDGRGPFARPDFGALERVLALQTFLAVVAMTSLAVAAVVASRAVAERRAADVEGELRAVFEAARIGHIVVDERGRIAELNDAFVRLAGRAPDGLRGLSLGAIVTPADRHLARRALIDLLSGRCDAVDAEVALDTTGEPVVVSAHATILPGHDARRGRRVLVQAIDITERKRFEERLRRMADHDDLTGLLNRRRFDQELEQHLAATSRYGAEGALLVLDIDEFKQVNDTLGHGAGDEVIVAVARVLRDRLRSTDVLARLGGDEFAALLPRAGRDEAAAVARSLVEAIRDYAAGADGAVGGVTISVGVAPVPHGVAVTADELLVAADAAMYAAKQSGRDRHVLAPAPVVA